MSDCDCVQQDYMKHLENQNDDLKSENTKLKADLLTISGKTNFCPLCEGYAKDRDRWRTLAGKMEKALKGQIQMRDMKKPRKLEEELSWRDNDDLAAKWADEALAAYEAAVKEKP